jgi:hypothetical protein
MTKLRLSSESRKNFFQKLSTDRLLLVDNFTPTRQRARLAAIFARIIARHAAPGGATAARSA